MKKIMILLAAAAMMMACADNEVEKQAEQYIQQMFEALANEDLATVMTIGQEIEEWEASLDEKDKAKAEEDRADRRRDRAPCGSGRSGEACPYHRTFK